MRNTVIDDYKKSVSKFYDEVGEGFVYGAIVYPIIGRNQHYGFWHIDTKTYKEAAENQMREVITKGKIDHASVVLDAGCGVGGPMVFIAKETGCTVYGVTLSEREVKRTSRLIKQESLTNRVFVSLEDYTCLPYPDNFFDVIYAIESVCHAVPKVNFFEEAFRVLKPSGKLIISDGFRKRDPVNKIEAEIISTFMYGYELKEIVKSRVYEEEAKSSGFVDIVVENKLEQVARSVIFFKRLTLILRPLTYILQHLSPTLKVLHRNVLAGYYSGRGIEVGVADYAVIVCRKPEAKALS